MAAAASASAFLAHCAYPRLSFPSASSTYFQTHLSLKPISFSISPFSFSVSTQKPNIPLINQYKNIKKSLFLKASQSSYQDSSSESEGEDNAPPNEVGKSDDEADQERPSSLELTLSAYKEAILNGDEKIVSDVEELMYMVEKEKNELLEKVSTLSEENSAHKDKYIRLQADFDNFRKRTQNEKLTIRSNAQGEVIASLLPMVDNFERAKQHIKLETEQEKKIDASYQGIYKQFVEIMRSLGVSVVPTVGKPFDPMLHEAIAREESEEFEEGVVIEEFRRGFILEEQLLRPAMVKVSSGPGKSQSSSVADEPSEQPASAGAEEREFSEQST